MANFCNGLVLHNRKMDITSLLYMTSGTSLYGYMENIRVIDPFTKTINYKDASYYHDLDDY